MYATLVVQLKDLEAADKKKTTAHNTTMISRLIGFVRGGTGSGADGYNANNDTSMPDEFSKADIDNLDLRRPVDLKIRITQRVVLTREMNIALRKKLAKVSLHLIGGVYWLYLQDRLIRTGCVYLRGQP